MHTMHAFCAIQNEPCKPGYPLKKKQRLRLQHATTRKWLHSHLFSSPLSGNQEVRGLRVRLALGLSDSGDSMCKAVVSDLMLTACEGVAGGGYATRQVSNWRAADVEGVAGKLHDKGGSRAHGFG